MSTAMVTLVSAEGVEFELDRKVAMQSKAIAIFLDPTLGFRESQTNRIVCHDIPARLLQRVIDYLKYRQEYEHNDNYPEFHISNEEAVDVLLVADFFEV